MIETREQVLIGCIRSFYRNRNNKVRRFRSAHARNAFVSVRRRYVWVIRKYISELRELRDRCDNCPVTCDCSYCENWRAADDSRDGGGRTVPGATVEESDAGAAP